jgi:hypothetical protein
VELSLVNAGIEEFGSRPGPFWHEDRGGQEESIDYRQISTDKVSHQNRSIGKSEAPSIILSRREGDNYGVSRAACGR